VRGLDFSLLAGSWGIARLDPSAAVPEWASSGAFTSVSRTADELSIVCPEEAIPATCRAERGWAALKLHGPFPFSEIGILASITTPLAAAKVSIFAVSTFDTDYVFVPRANLPGAIAALEAAGHRRTD